MYVNRTDEYEWEQKEMVWFEKEHRKSFRKLMLATVLAVIFIAFICVVI